MLEEIRRHPFVAKAMSQGERGIGKLFAQILSNERLAAGLQSLAESSEAARRQLELGMRRLLHALQIPTLEEIETLKEKIGEIEALLSEMAERAGKSRRPAGRGKGEQP